MLWHTLHFKGWPSRPINRVAAPTLALSVAAALAEEDLPVVPNSCVSTPTLGLPTVTAMRSPGESPARLLITTVLLIEEPSDIVGRPIGHVGFIGLSKQVRRIVVVFVIAGVAVV